MAELTRLLNQVDPGNHRAAKDLLPLVYEELRRLARARMVQERREHTLQATALVHEAYLRLVGDGADWDSRGHFFAAAAEAMRRILIEHARARKSLKRGGGLERVALDGVGEALPVISPFHDIEDLLALDEALQRFAVEAPDKVNLVKLLYFAGLSLEEAASAMGISKTTAHRNWIYARAWLLDAMERGSP
jgi:RNA polymerase sigma factor (TIGR02999 family)